MINCIDRLSNGWTVIKQIFEYYIQLVHHYTLLCVFVKSIPWKREYAFSLASRITRLGAPPSQSTTQIAKRLNRMNFQSLNSNPSFLSHSPNPFQKRPIPRFILQLQSVPQKRKHISTQTPPVRDHKHNHSSGITKFGSSPF
jgi:hypothetical protein